MVERKGGEEMWKEFKVVKIFGIWMDFEIFHKFSEVGRC